MEHEEVGECFTYFQDSLVPFDNQNSVGTIKIVKAFNKNFIFYYKSNIKLHMIYFGIILIGRKCDAEQFYYELTIKSPIENYRKIKFVSDMYNDNYSIEELCQNGQCINLNHPTVKNHLYENKIYFRFVIHKKEKDDEKGSVAASAVPCSKKQKDQLHKKPDKPILTGFPIKGALKSNTQRKPTSTPTSSPSPSSSSSNKKIEFIHIDTKKNVLESSINKIKLRDGLCHVPGVVEIPCLTPSISRQITMEDNVTKELNILPNPRSSYPISKVTNYKNSSSTMSRENNFGKSSKFNK